MSAKPTTGASIFPKVASPLVHFALARLLPPAVINELIRRYRQTCEQNGRCGLHEFPVQVPRGAIVTVVMNVMTSDAVRVPLLLMARASDWRAWVDAQSTQ
jgi:hypothetical protein